MTRRYQLDNVSRVDREDPAGTLSVVNGRLGRSSTSSPRIDLEGAIVLPAFINAHDHLELDGLPRTGRHGAYGNAREWFADVQTARAAPGFERWLRLPLGHRLTFGGFLNLLNGCLTVSHHNPYYRWHFTRRFPVDVVRRYGWCHSLALENDPRKAFEKTPPGAPFVLHFAEGVDASAQREIEQVGELGLLQRRTVLVHAVGLDGGDLERIADAGAGVVWCPGSNLFLFGRTLDVKRALAAGVTVALGSDSTLSGEGGLLRELRRARESSGLSGTALLRLVTEAPAELFGLTDRGALRPALRADLLVLDRNLRPESFCPSRLEPASIELVVRRGRPVLGAPRYADLFDRLGVSVRRVSLPNMERLLEHRYARTLDRLLTACPRVFDDWI